MFLSMYFKFEAITERSSGLEHRRSQLSQSFIVENKVPFSHVILALEMQRYKAAIFYNVNSYIHQSRAVWKR